MTKWLQSLWTLVLKSWRLIQRRIDRKILWKTIKEQAPDQRTARQVFAWHMKHDPAYSDLTQSERSSYLDRLR